MNVVEIHMNGLTEISMTITNNDYDKQIWIDDFENKGRIVSSKYNECLPEELYAALTGSMDNGCTLLIEELPSRRVRKVQCYAEIIHYLDNYNKVLIYAKDFNKGSCIAMRFMVYLNAFVIDIDNVRTHNLNIALGKINASPVKPNFIVNSGNGLHLYYIFKEKFDFMNYTSGMAFIRDVKRIKITGGKKKVYTITTADKIKDIYSTMLDWFTDPSYKTDKLHLAHGIRMFGGKTKNTKILSTVYRGYEEQYDLETLAEITGVELFTREEDEKYEQMFGSNAKIATAVDAADVGVEDAEPKTEIEAVEVVVSLLPVVYVPVKRVKSDWTSLTEQLCEIRNSQKPARREVPKWEQYNYLVSAIKEYVEVGIRNRSLFIMCCRGKLFKIPENVVKKDLKEVAEHMNVKTPTDMITAANIEKAFIGYYSDRRFTNGTITKITGIPFDRTQKEKRKYHGLIKCDETKVMLGIVVGPLGANASKILSQSEANLLCFEAVLESKGMKSEDLSDIFTQVLLWDTIFLLCGLEDLETVSLLTVLATAARKAGAMVVGIVPSSEKINYFSSKTASGLFSVLNNCVLVSEACFSMHGKHSHPQPEEHSISYFASAITAIYTKQMFIGIDFYDVKHVMCLGQKSRLGVGVAAVVNRSRIAANLAMQCIENQAGDLRLAKGVLVNVEGPSNLTIDEFDEVSETVRTKLDADCHVIIGLVINDQFDNKLKVTILSVSEDS